MQETLEICRTYVQTVVVDQDLFVCFQNHLGGGLGTKEIIAQEIAFSRPTNQDCKKKIVLLTNQLVKWQQKCSFYRFLQLR